MSLCQVSIQRHPTPRAHKTSGQENEHIRPRIMFKPIINKYKGPNGKGGRPIVISLYVRPYQIVSAL